MSGEGITEHRRPLDTSTLGPIRVEPNAIADRARVVREALCCIADPIQTPGTEYGDRVAAWELSTASDETLAKLGRLIR